MGSDSLMNIRLPLILILLLGSSLATAQHVYRWVDESGETHYGHSVPPEHAHRGYERLGRDGTVRQRFAPALTPEERAERAERMALEAQLEAEQRSQETRDRMLLSSYGTVEDIETTMNMQLASLSAQRVHLDSGLAEQVRRFETQIARAAQYNRDGQPVPERLTASINDSQREARRLRQALADLDKREEAIRRQFEAEAERFRELTSNSQP